MLTDKEVILRLILAAVLGGLVGIEREVHNRKIAGFRTHIIVCVGAALVMLTALFIANTYSYKGSVDPGRIAVGVITGIGFLGAGTIIRSETSVIGLTTAASLWTVSAIGLAVGCGFYIAGLVTTGIVMTALYLLRKIK